MQAIERMVDEDVPCEDILAQINAVKSALHKVGQVVLEGHIQHCGEASAPDKELLHAFCEDLCAGYACVISGDKNVLFKLKSLWIYLGMSFTNPQKYLKKIKKANRLAEYEEAVDALFREQELIL